MNYVALFLFVFSTLSATAMPPIVRKYESPRKTFKGPDRTITWRPWQQSPEGDFRFRTGDRYLGGQVWEHYLGFEQYRASVKAIKLSMIRLGKSGCGRGSSPPTGSTLRDFQNNQRHNDRPQRRQTLCVGRLRTAHARIGENASGSSQIKPPDFGF